MIARYSVALGSFLLACGLTWVTLHTIGPNFIITALFMVAVLASAWWGGYGPGMLCAAGAVMLGPLMSNSTHVFNINDATRLLIAVTVSAMVSRLSESQKNTAAELRRMNDVLDERVRERTAALRESEARLSLALEAGRMGAWEWNIRTGVVTWSPQLEAIHGIRPGGFDGTFEAFQQDIHPDHRERVLEAIQKAVRERHGYANEYMLVRPDGLRIWVEARGQLLVDSEGEPERLVGVCMEITDRKRGEEAQRRQAEELKRSNADLQQFAYVASHDLQEPLRMVATYVQLLARKYSGHMDEEAERFIAFSVEGVRRMDNLIRDLLSYSRLIHADPIAPVAVSLSEALGDALKNLDAALRESGAKLTCRDLPSVPCDRSQMAQVFQNLIGNALKYRSDGTPEIEVSAEESGDAWVVRVRDNGIGIAREYHETIFGPFKRLHGREYPGTGVGLAICKRIVERHGGRIGVESAVGAGAEFVFTLPAAGKSVGTGA